MKRMVWLVAIFLLTGGVVAAGQETARKSAIGTPKPVASGQSCGSSVTDASVLMNADKAFNDASATRGLEGFLSFLADDVATLRPDQPILTGKQALAEVWTPLFTNPALSIRWKPLHGSISAGGDLGFTVGSYEITRSDEQGKRVISTGKYVTIWRRQADGAWKVAFDSGVPDTPPASAKP